jgi:long-chain acyl-CoA synthetase
MNGPAADRADPCDPLIAFLALADAAPAALAVVDGTLRLSRAELAAAIIAGVQSLRRLGVAPGDRVALSAPDGAPALVAALAVIHADAVHVPFDHALAPAEITAAAGVLRVDWQLRPTGIDASGWALTSVRAIPEHDRASSSDPLHPQRSAFLRLSSGTTGAAKGVLIARDTLAARVAAAAPALALGPDDRVLWLLPMAYHFAVSILLYIGRGAGVVFGNALRAASTATIARDHAVTFAYGSPWHVRRLAELPAGSLPASLRQVVATTAAIDPGTAAAFRAHHGIRVRQALGIIEVGLPFVSPGHDGEAPGELGDIQPAFRLAILPPGDEAGVTAEMTDFSRHPHALPAGTEGELAIAGPGLFDAYVSPWRARANVLDCGFFRTGDRAVCDAAGRVRLLGRIKDVINVGGVKVFPLEVESVLDAHPMVAASRVRAAPDARLGEAVMAEVAVHPGTDAATIIAELEAWCAERLAPMKRPGRIVVVDALPRTGSGKVIR